MTPLNFELWFRAEEYPESPLAEALVTIESKKRSLTQQESTDLAADFLPDHRLARDAREHGERLINQLDAADRAMRDAQSSSASYSLSLRAGIEVLGDERIALGSAKAVVEQLVQATSLAHTNTERLNQQLTSALAEVGQLRAHMEVVRRESLTDALTDLPNRKAFDGALVKACASGENVVVAMVDIDHFKQFNDRWGHATGDQVLKFVAAMIGRTAHAPRLAARYGGEEFAMLFPEEAAGAVKATLDNMLKQIRERTLTRRTTGEQLGSLTVSVGIAEGRGARPEALMSEADEALYASKHAGRDQVTLLRKSEAQAA